MPENTPKPDDDSRWRCTLHGLFALTVLGTMLTACVQSWFMNLGRCRRPYFPQFLVSTSGATPAVYEGTPPGGGANCELIIFFRQGPEVSLPFKIYERWQYAATVPPIGSFTPEQIAQAIADYLKSNPQGSWNSMRVGPPPTLSTDTGTNRLTSTAWSSFHPWGLAASASVWLVAGLACRSGLVWLRRPPPRLAPRCPSCHYDTRGLRTPVCPECGTCTESKAEASQGTSP
ncbi:MAG: hypothetical protein U0637_05595 [Phycisphaerales bacterium]